MLLVAQALYFQLLLDARPSRLTLGVMADRLRAFLVDRERRNTYQ